MSYSLNSLKVGYIGDYIGTTMGVIKGDTRSLDSGSIRVVSLLRSSTYSTSSPSHSETSICAFAEASPFSL